MNVHIMFVRQTDERVLLCKLLKLVNVTARHGLLVSYKFLNFRQKKLTAIDY